MPFAQTNPFLDQLTFCKIKFPKPGSGNFFQNAPFCVAQKKRLLRIETASSSGLCVFLLYIKSKSVLKIGA